MLHFIGIFGPREDYPEGDDRQKPFFGPQLRVTQPRRQTFDEPDDRPPLPTDPAETMRFAELLAPPFL